MRPDLLARDLAVFRPFEMEGRVKSVTSARIEADGPDLAIGAHCLIWPVGDKAGSIRAQVVAVGSNGLTLAPFEDVRAVSVGNRVTPINGLSELVAGDALAGRAIDALCRPLDGDPKPRGIAAEVSLPPVLDRISPWDPLPTGVHAIDGLLTIGRGCRMGILAASGVGKTTLMAQMIRHAHVDRTVICLVGERGREVEAFWNTMQADDTGSRTTLVAATSDESAPMRVQAVDTALRICEHWRSKGEHVFLVIDSVTRYAMALREIGLLAGEPPTLRAYTPGVFRELPRIVERCGATRNSGAITAVFTVLSESDDADDPITEVMKSLLDGHIVLSRKLAQAGHFPAIDIGRSLSRLFGVLTSPEHNSSAARIRAMLARYEEARLLIESGMYKPGGDLQLDLAVVQYEHINAFLRQSDGESADYFGIVNRVMALGSVQ